VLVHFKHTCPAVRISGHRDVSHSSGFDGVLGTYAACVAELCFVLCVFPSLPSQVFHGIVPKLLKQPVSSAGLRALGQLAGTAGEGVYIVVTFF
jgi:hypothetical protein